jgi:hypothetical protein
MKTLPFAIASLFTLALTGCAAGPANDETAQNEAEIRSRTTWFRVNGKSPGYIVSGADDGRIACPGGRVGATCALDVIDFSALRMPAADVAEIDQIARRGDLLVRGSLKIVAGKTRLAVAEAYENVRNDGRNSYFDMVCDHGYLHRSGTAYARGARLVGVAYNDTVDFRPTIETDSDIIVDARDLVAEGMASAKGLLVCMNYNSASDQIAKAVLINVKDTYAP